MSVTTIGYCYDGYYPIQLGNFNPVQYFSVPRAFGLKKSEHFPDLVKLTRFDRMYKLPGHRPATAFNRAEQSSDITAFIADINDHPPYTVAFEAGYSLERTTSSSVQIEINHFTTEYLSNSRIIIRITKDMVSRDRNGNFQYGNWSYKVHTLYYSGTRWINAVTSKSLRYDKNLSREEAISQCEAACQSLIDSLLLVDDKVPREYKVMREVEPSSLKNLISAYWQNARLCAERNSSKMEKIDYSELAAAAYQGIGAYQGNGFSELKELFSMPISIVKQTKSTLGDLMTILPGTKRAKRLMKVASATYLSIHYGYKLTLMDVDEIVETLAQCAKNDYQRASSQTTVNFEETSETVTYACIYRLYGSLIDSIKGIMKPMPVRRVRNSVERIGTFLSKIRLGSSLFDLDPDLLTIWDNLPFSFMVDWFSNVSGILSSLDNFYDLMNKHDLIACTVAHRFVTTLHIKDNVDIGSGLQIKVQGTVASSTFEIHDVPPIQPAPHLELHGNASMQHLLEAGACLIQIL